MFNSCSLSCCCISATKFIDEIQCWALPHLVADDWTTDQNGSQQHIETGTNWWQSCNCCDHPSPAPQNKNKQQDLMWKVQSCYWDWSVSGYPNQSYLSCFKQKKSESQLASNNFNACLGWSTFITSSLKTRLQSWSTDPQFFCSSNPRPVFLREISDFCRDFCKWTQCQIQVIQNKLIAFQVKKAVSGKGTHALDLMETNYLRP